MSLFIISGRFSVGILFIKSFKKRLYADFKEVAVKLYIIREYTII